MKRVACSVTWSNIPAEVGFSTSISSTGSKAQLPSENADTVTLISENV